MEQRTALEAGSDGVARAEDTARTGTGQRSADRSGSGGHHSCPTAARSVGGTYGCAANGSIYSMLQCSDGIGLNKAWRLDQLSSD